VADAVVAELFTSRRAEEELREIWRYIAAENPTAANRLLLRIDDKLQILRDFPGMGTLRDDIRPGLRMLVEGNYLLLYEHDANNDVVELISVIDGRRDLSALF
jgi:toxin ParE1/3/4